MPIFRIAGGRILSTVKMHLIKGRSCGDPFCQAVEEVVQDLDLKIKNIIDSQHEALTASTTGLSPARVMGLLLFFLLFSFTRKQMSFACLVSSLYFKGLSIEYYLLLTVQSSVIVVLNFLKRLILEDYSVDFKKLIYLN